MTKIFIDKNVYQYDDLFKEEIHFVDNENEIILLQAGSGDLYFSSLSYDKLIEMEIDKFNNYQAYMIFDNLYNRVKNSDEKKIDRDDICRDMLFDGEIISFKSDAPANEYMDEEFKYCYLNIYKEEDKYLLKFINDYPNENYSLNINTDRSRYGPYRFTFVKLYRELSNIDNQITIDEYLYKKKILERKN